MNSYFKARNFFRLYIGVCLVGVVFLSPLLYSLLSLAFLALSIYSWRRGSTLLELATSYSAIFIVPLLWEPTLGYGFPAFLSLPLLAYIDILLRSGTAQYYVQDSRVSRRPTELGITLLVSLVPLAGLAVLLANWTLGLATIASALYFTIVAILILWSIPGEPLRQSKTFFRVLAGNQASREIEIFNLTRLGGYVYLKPLDSWLKITPKTFPLDKPKISVTISFAPPLAGPASPEVYAMILDPWGLSQVKHRFELVQLHIIPRTKYAVWLAKKYLETARQGTVVSYTPPPQTGGSHVARRGGEYYGARPYLPGDNPNVIDWKHSAKLGKLIVQEYEERFTTSPLIVINLAAGDQEEADSLAFCVLTTALTLAKEGIPTAIAAYNESTVVIVTDVLGPIELVQRAMTLIESASIYQVPSRYLKPVDVSRLKMNHDRLKGIELDSVKKLEYLLSLEYTAIKASAELNPATLAITRGLARGKKLAQLLVISNFNHDAETLTMLASNVSKLGLKALFLEVGKPLYRGQFIAQTRPQLASRVLSQ